MSEQPQPYTAPPITAPHLSTREMNLLEKTFNERAEQSTQSGHWLSRKRLWLIFVLIRHAGLRLGEVLSLDDEKELHLETGQVAVKGPHKRTVPLPPAILPELRKFLSHDLVASRRGDLTHLDQGYIRRNFYARAKESGLSPDLASPRALRQSRAIEMIQNGMPLPAIQQFLGQPSLENTAELLSYSDEDIKQITRHYLFKEAKLKTSARNVFPGQVKSIRQDSFMVEVTLTTFSGLNLDAIITSESLDNLQLNLGKTVVANVKAPFVLISREEKSKRHYNCFSGTIERLTSTEILSEVIVALPEGSTACAVITTDSVRELGLALGQEVIVHFKAMSVVLTLP